jgi:ribosomal protein L31E
MAEKDKADERLLTIPLRSQWLKVPKNRRAGRSVKTIRAYISRHMKVSEDVVKVSSKLNSSMWVRGAARPPPSVRVKTSLDAEAGLLHAMLPDEKPPEPKKAEKEKAEKPAGLAQAAKQAADRISKARDAGKPAEPRSDTKKEEALAKPPEAEPASKAREAKHGK